LAWNKKRSMVIFLLFVLNVARVAVKKILGVENAS
jgi:hypothetical protein